MSEAPHDSGAAQRLRTAVASLNLTQKQAEITELICSGLTTNKVADRAGITEATMRSHLRTVFQRLELRSRVDLVALVTDRVLEDAGYDPSRDGHEQRDREDAPQK